VSDDRVTVFRRFHEAWTRGDLDTVRRLVEPDVVVRPLHGAMFTRSEFRGRDGVAEWYRQMTEPWERFEALERITEVERRAKERVKRGETDPVPAVTAVLLFDRPDPGPLPEPAHGATRSDDEEGAGSPTTGARTP